jgi:Tol biopolymer transport system component
VAYRRATESPSQVFKVSVTLPEKAEFGLSPPAVSPDGRRIAFVANADGKSFLWVRDLDALSARALAGTEGADHPFWSPDGRYVAFFGGGKLKKIEAAGGTPVTLCDASNQPRGGSWSKRDVIVFAPSPSNGLFRVPAAGGTPTLVKKPGRFPWFLPDGRHFLYTVGLQGGLYFADLDSDAQERVLVADTNALYAPPGYLLFLREGTLMAQPFDARSGKTTGEAVPLAEQVGSILSNGQGQFSASQTPAKYAVLVYTSGSTGEAQLTWYDRSGNALGTVGKPGSPLRPAISPDGSTVAVDRADPQTGVVDVWLLNLARGTESRFTFGQPRNLIPVWSPDGSHIAFNSMRNLSQKMVSGSGRNEAVEKLLDSPHGGESRIFAVDWTRDGRYIVEQLFDDPNTKADIWVLPLAGDHKAVPYLRSESNEQYARVSPNGRWLAYASDESKRFEIYVQTFPNPGEKSQVSANGGTLPVWSRDGKELYFVAPDGKMMAADVKGAGVNDPARFEAGKPIVLFDSHIPADGSSRYDVSKDSRFLIPTPVNPPGSGQITVVVNWTTVLKK